jgi:leucyl aminopeptidase
MSTRTRNTLTQSAAKAAPAPKAGSAQAAKPARKPRGEASSDAHGLPGVKVKGFAGLSAKGSYVLGLSSDGGFTPGAQAVNEALGGLLVKLRKSGEISDKKAAVTVLRQPDGQEGVRLVVVGLGKASELSTKAFAAAANAAARAAHALPKGACHWMLHDAPVQGADTQWAAAMSVQAVHEASYRFDQCKSKTETNSDSGISDLVLISNPEQQKAAISGAQSGRSLASGMALAKDLGNLPGNICTPTYLAKTALALGKSHGLSVQILERKDMEKLGMGSLLSVAKGSIEPPKLIIMKYNGGPARQAPVALVGKGITFDTGGISLKPGADMDEMKFDMCGAASVFGTLKAIAEMRLKLNVIGVIPTCENMPSGGASKPGDIVKSMSGQTIEVLNTDAEGRLILCDALTYTERLKPAAVVDIATLTGACVIALGHINSGLFSKDDDLAQELLDAGQQALDPAWRMPLDDEYQDGLKSNFADMANIGGRAGGSITAACFLSRYTKNFRWAHLDIAGTAFRSGAAKGSSARPVPLLVNFLKNRA